MFLSALLYFACGLSQMNMDRQFKLFRQLFDASQIAFGNGIYSMWSQSKRYAFGEQLLFFHFEQFLITADVTFSDVTVFIFQEEQPYGGAHSHLLGGAYCLLLEPVHIVKEHGTGLDHFEYSEF